MHMPLTLPRPSRTLTTAHPVSESTGTSSIVHQVDESITPRRRSITTTLNTLPEEVESGGSQALARDQGLRRRDNEIHSSLVTRYSSLMHSWACCCLRYLFDSYLTQLLLLPLLPGLL
mmetsp:Transcript_23391/g.43499  ORF Transcript_23391/g.43499 Transcript_23391/m.43499 type:complete len:118 (+) Transcript_23391:497-850(+)